MTHVYESCKSRIKRRSKNKISKLCRSTGIGRAGLKKQYDPEGLNKKKDP